MFRNRKENRPGMGKIVDHEDFFIIRPKKFYRYNSSVIILKDEEEPFMIDVGTSEDPGVHGIKKAFLKYNINPSSIKKIFLTHSHFDHTQNFFNIQKYCSNAKFITEESEWDDMQIRILNNNSFRTKSINLIGKSLIPSFFYSFLSIPLRMWMLKSFKSSPKVDYTFKFDKNLSNFSIDNCPSFKSGKLRIKIIPTPGHSIGHSSILDSNKNLYLGDFVPFVPWILPAAESLDKMIVSIKNIIKLGENDVKQAIRNHGDIRRDPNYNGKGKLKANEQWFDDNSTWEVANWGGEKGERTRFQFFLDTINDSLESIPRFLEKKPLNIHQITHYIIPHYKQTSRFISLLIPAPLTWMICYLLKLEEQGLVKKIKRDHQFLWTI
ncbi:MAG: MBL fold metallo-hydrolase [archaeon]|nr:MBL fold metallo-hydrolase [archaeon]